MAVQTLPSVDAAVAWLRSRGVAGTLRTDSRQVLADDAFVAWPGRRSDGRAHVAEALTAGAAACLVEADGAEAFAFDGSRVAALPDLRRDAGRLADRWFGSPSAQLQVLAVTGTNGKTSSACWIAQALTALGQPCGVIGTLGAGRPGAFVETGLTTPDAVTLQACLAGFVQQQLVACALEASSIGLVEHRLDGTRIAVAAFTNFTQDHLDYHGSMAAYWQAKRSLFAWPGLRAAVVNVDDGAGQDLAAELAAEHGLALWTVSLRPGARLHGRDLHYEDGGLSLEVVEGERSVQVRSRLVGEHNASNLLGVLATLRALDIPLTEAAAAVAQLGPVPGRLEQVPAQGPAQPLVVVDYAHTPDALEKALRALRPLATARAGRLWCIFGCGGDRDATKRPLMGAIAARDADHVVLTSDNPRSESPRQILAQILMGVARSDAVDVIEDRAQAIADAVRRADAADVLLLAGKGHEQVQEVMGERRPFSDLGEARACLARRAEGALPC